MLSLIKPGMDDDRSVAAHLVGVHWVEQLARFWTGDHHAMCAQRVALDAPTRLQRLDEERTVTLHLWIVSTGRGGGTQVILRNVDSLQSLRKRRVAGAKARMRVAERRDFVVWQRAIRDDNDIQIARVGIEVTDGQRPHQVHPAQAWPKNSLDAGKELAQRRVDRWVCSRREWVNHRYPH